MYMHKDLTDEKDDDDADEHHADLQLFALGGRRDGRGVVLQIARRAVYFADQAHVQHEQCDERHDRRQGDIDQPRVDSDVDVVESQFSGLDVRHGAIVVRRIAVPLDLILPEVRQATGDGQREHDADRRHSDPDRADAGSQERATDGDVPLDGQQNSQPD